jgi:hypothetical protein
VNSGFILTSRIFKRKLSGKHLPASTFITVNEVTLSHPALSYAIVKLLHPYQQLSSWRLESLQAMCWSEFQPKVCISQDHTQARSFYIDETSCNCLCERLLLGFAIQKKHHLHLLRSSLYHVRREVDADHPAQRERSTKWLRRAREIREGHAYHPIRRSVDRLPHSKLTICSGRRTQRSSCRKYYGSPRHRERYCSLHRDPRRRRTPVQ